MTLDEKVEKELARAGEWAERGAASVMEAFLSAAKEYALNAGQDIAERVKEIEKVGYKNAVPVELALARENAERGDASFMEAYLSLAKEYAQKAGLVQDIAAQVKKIAEAGYKNAVPKELALAREKAGEGNALAMEAYLSLAKWYAQKAGQGISAQVLAEIVEETRALIKK